MIETSKTFGPEVLKQLVLQQAGIPPKAKVEVLCDIETRGRQMDEYKEAVFKGIKVTWKDPAPTLPSSPPANLVDGGY